VPAKVFNSCGQASEAERHTAKAIGEELDRLGFDFYIAVEEVSLRGLKENIFEQLASSEYFLFVDFPRERLDNGDERRGSLFSHQELAIASFLDMPVLAFRHHDVKELDGLARFLHMNSVPFGDVDLLPALVQEQVRTRGWDPNWKNALWVERPDYLDIDVVNNEQRPARFFHLPVINNHRSKTATNCIGYVESIGRVDSSEAIPHLLVELRWAGSIVPSVAIPPKHTRFLDVGFVYHDQPGIMLLNSFATSFRFGEPLIGPGKFRVTYLVVADGFAPARSTVEVTLSDDFNSVEVIQADHT